MPRCHHLILRTSKFHRDKQEGIKVFEFAAKNDSPLAKMVISRISRSWSVEKSKWEELEYLFLWPISRNIARLSDKTGITFQDSDLARSIHASRWSSNRRHMASTVWESFRNYWIIWFYRREMIHCVIYSLTSVSSPFQIISTMKNEVAWHFFMHPCDRFIDILIACSDRQLKKRSDRIVPSAGELLYVTLYN